MNSEPLSESMPRIGNGNWEMTYSMASKTQIAALFLTDRLMVHPVKTSVTVRVKQNSPLELPPVADQVDFDEPGHIFAPLGPGADRDLGLE